MFAAEPVNPTEDKPPRRARSGPLRSVALVGVPAATVIVVLVAGLATGAAPGHSPAPTGDAGDKGRAAGPVVHADRAVSSRCPWLATAMDHHLPPAALARDVVGRMTLAEKLGEIVLFQSGLIENFDAGVPRLCIPPLHLQDGTQGVAFGATNVTQLPAPLGIAATFDTSLARSYGDVIGTEATGQGIDAIQGPDLNIDRVPESGRSYETFGEDPVLVSAMGVADIDGIQATGAMAMAKHLAVYSQETNRSDLDDVVSQRALEEIYLPPFQAAVTQAHVSSLMCAYPQLNGVFQCQDPQLADLLDQWGFAGFVRSDLGAVHNPVAALEAGVDLIKPSTTAQLAELVEEKRLPLTAVDNAVTRVLTQMFAYGLVGRPPAGAPDAPVDSPSDTAFALHSAERSAVLLKDDGAVLPLSGSRSQSVAVIGADADTAPVTTGYGSSEVVPPFVSTPLAAIRRRAAPGASVTYSDGGSTNADLAPIPSGLLTTASGGKHGLTLTLTQTGAARSAPSIRYVEPTIDTAITPHPATSPALASPTQAGPVDRHHTTSRIGPRPLKLATPLAPTHSNIVLPAGWSDVSAAWTGTLTPPRSGLYTLSLQGSGGASLTLGGKVAVADTLPHIRGVWSRTVHLVGDHPYPLRLDWEPYDIVHTSGQQVTAPGQLTVGWSDVSDQINSAVAAARKADVAVVFAGDFSSEAFDRPSLSLPGDENELIAAVAAANPRTVVVLNTGGPVLMPWVRHVAGLIEAWYPGEEDGAAIAALLFGDFDPSGHLPVTFPASEAQSALHTPAQWPGVRQVSHYSEGLEVGYRYDHAHHIRPLFPFGYGLSYTHFTLQGLAVGRTAKGVTLTVHVTDAGTRPGTCVPQAYLTYPSAAGEPPAELVAFYPVSLRPGQSRSVSLFVPLSAFRAFVGGTWTTVPGRYTLAVGQSSSELPLSTSMVVHGPGVGPGASPPAAA